MTDLAPGTPVKIATPYKFPKDNVASLYFPDGITAEHYLISMDEPSHSRATVLVRGIFTAEGASRLATWNNPVFRLPLWHFDPKLVKANG